MSACCRFFCAKSHHFLSLELLLITCLDSQGAWAFGSIIGPIIGGAVASPGRWRWVFWLMLPFCGMGLVCIWAFVSQIQRPEATVRDMMSRVDWVGGILFIGSATSFLVAVSWGGTTYAWDSWTTLVPLVVGIVGLVVTMAYERLIAGDRAFLRHSLFHVWSAHSVYFGAFTQGLVVSIISLNAYFRTNHSFFPF